MGYARMWKVALQIRPPLYSRVVLGGTAAFFIPSGMRKAAFFCATDLSSRFVIGRRGGVQHGHADTTGEFS